MCEQCDHCNQPKYVASRMDIWNTANARLRSEEWDGENVAPHDVFLLAQFLAGDTLMEQR